MANVKARNGDADLLDSMCPAIEMIRDHLQSQFDDLTENQQDGDKGERLQTQIDAVQAVIETIETASVELRE